MLFGRSLGGAVAVAAAAQCNAARPVRGLIIENSFTSVADMAKSVLPIVRLLGPALPHFVRNKWESAKAVSARLRVAPTTSPVRLCSISHAWDVVPPVRRSSLSLRQCSSCRQRTTSLCRQPRCGALVQCAVNPRPLALTHVLAACSWTRYAMGWLRCEDRELHDVSVALCCGLGGVGFVGGFLTVTL